MKLTAEPIYGNPALPGSPAFQRFAQELAYYLADAPYLTVDKCAERCWLLSVLLTIALDLDNNVGVP